MNIGRKLFIAAIFAVSTGCATTAGTTGKVQLNVDNNDDGIIRQRIEFKDLPAEMQESITNGG
jgi:hypothetical protein